MQWIIARLLRCINTMTTTMIKHRDGRANNGIGEIEAVDRGQADVLGVDCRE